MSGIVFLLRAYHLSVIVYTENEALYELESCLQTFSGICLLGLASIDAFAVYKEVSLLAFKL